MEEMNELFQKQMKKIHVWLQNAAMDMGTVAEHFEDAARVLEDLSHELADLLNEIEVQKKRRVKDAQP